MRSPRTPGIVPGVAVALLVAVLAVVGVVVGTLVVRDAPDDVRGEPREVDPRLVTEVEATGVSPYVIDVRGAAITDVSAEVDPVDGRRIRVTYALPDGAQLSTNLAPAPPRPRPCAAVVDQGGSCEVVDGVTISSFEEMSSVSRVLGDTMLTAQFTSESDPTIVTDVTTAVQNATEVSATELVDLLR